MNNKVQKNLSSADNSEKYRIIHSRDSSHKKMKNKIADSLCFLL